MFFLHPSFLTSAVCSPPPALPVSFRFLFPQSPSAPSEMNLYMYFSYSSDLIKTSLFFLASVSSVVLSPSRASASSCLQPAPALHSSAFLPSGCACPCTSRPSQDQCAELALVLEGQEGLVCSVRKGCIPCARGSGCCAQLCSQPGAIASIPGACSLPAHAAAPQDMLAAAAASSFLKHLWLCYRLLSRRFSISPGSCYPVTHCLHEQTGDGDIPASVFSCCPDLLRCKIIKR